MREKVDPYVKKPMHKKLSEPIHASQSRTIPEKAHMGKAYVREPIHA